MWVLGFVLFILTSSSMHRCSNFLRGTQHLEYVHVHSSLRDQCLWLSLGLSSSKTKGCKVRIQTRLLLRPQYLCSSSLSRYWQDRCWSLWVSNSLPDARDAILHQKEILVSTSCSPALSASSCLQDWAMKPPYLHKHKRRNQNSVIWTLFSSLGIPTMLLSVCSWHR